MFALVSAHAGHLVTSFLISARRTTSRRTERGAYRRNHQSQHCQERKHGCVCRSDTNWNRFVHSFIFTRHSNFRGVNSNLMAMARQSEKRCTPSIGSILMFDARQKASAVPLLVILKLDPAQPRQLQRRQPRATYRQPNPILKGS